jgi:hypothetical protein
MKHRNYKVSYVINGIEMSFIKNTTEKAISKAIHGIVKGFANAENQGYHTLYVSDERQEWRGENGKIIIFEIKTIKEIAE